MEMTPASIASSPRSGERFNAIYLFRGSRASLIVDTGLAAGPGRQRRSVPAAIGLQPATCASSSTPTATSTTWAAMPPCATLFPEALLMCGEEDRSLVEDVERMIAERYGEFALDHGLDDTEETKAWIRGVARAVPVDVGLTGGERIHLGDGWRVEVLHTPGHSLGSVSVWDARSGSLAIGDAVLGSAVLLADGAAAFPPTYRFVETYAATIQRLQGMPIERLMTSHYPLYEGRAAVAGFLDESRAYVDRVDATLRDELAAGGVAHAGRADPSA